LTQEQLAKRLAVTSRAVQAWEAGSRFPGLRAQRSLSEVFGKPPTYFRERDE
jgi:transcriptional regulator with XRE-family HTH domain